MSQIREESETGGAVGITPFEHHLLTLAMGSSYPLMYAEIGTMYHSLTRGKGKLIPESMFRPRFLKACDKGLICWADTQQVWENWKERKFILTKRGEEALRTWNIAYGGDYAYNKYFDGSEDSLDKNMPGKKTRTIVGGNSTGTRSKAEQFQEHNDRVEAARLAVDNGSRDPRLLALADGKKVT